MSEDYKAFKEGIERMRQDRLDKFLFIWKPKIESLDIKVFYLESAGRYTFHLGSLGIVDFYPKANRLLIRKTNRWHSRGLEQLIKELKKRE